MANGARTRQSNSGNGAFSGLTWAEPAQDLGAAVGLEDLLIGLQLMATSDDREDARDLKKWDDDTPLSMQVIKSGALAITKAWTKRVTAAGGLGGLAAAITGGLTAWNKDFRTDNGVPVIVALIAGAALILAAAAIAIALFVKGDLEARGVATAARHQARGEVAAAFLNATSQLPKSPSEAPPTPPPPPVNGPVERIEPDVDLTEVVRLLDELAVRVGVRIVQ